MSVRKITNKGGKKVIGKFASYLMWRIILWESKLERDFLYLLEFDPDVLWYNEQPMKIFYNFDGKIRRYTPDFLVIRKRKKQIIEVKSKDKVFKGNNGNRFHIISRICQVQGYEFKIVTDETIRIQPRLANIKLLWKYARTLIHPQHQVYCRELFHNKQEIALGEVMRSFQARGIGIQVVYSMIYHGVIFIDLMQPITPDSIAQLINTKALAG